MSGLGAFSMWDLFRGEVESQMKLLTESLLAVEGGAPADAHLAAAMRAAHSIKGAARIVQLDVGVRVAHVMEDCLVAAQSGALTISGPGLDVLLAAGDMLSQLASVDEAGVSEWVAAQESSVQDLLGALERVRTGTYTAPAPPATGRPRGRCSRA